MGEEALADGAARDAVNAMEKVLSDSGREHDVWVRARAAVATLKGLLK